MSSLLLLVLLSIQTVVSLNCPANSKQWCQSKEIAQACGVVDQCQKFVWADDKVNFALYYETLCPDCRQFMTTQLWTAYQSILDIMNITLVPYGNARETYNPTTKLYDFVCQHGPNECLGNLIHSCVLYYHPLINDHMPFIKCTESKSGDVRSDAIACAQQTQIDFKQIDSCMNSTLSNQLEHQFAQQTDSLQPAHRYVPWVTVNGVHTEKIQDEAQRNLVGLICKSYKGSNPPAACKKM